MSCTLYLPTTYSTLGSHSFTLSDFYHLCCFEYTENRCALSILIVTHAKLFLSHCKCSTSNIKSQLNPKSISWYHMFPSFPPPPHPASAGDIEVSLLPLCSKTALRLALLESMNSLYSLATWSVPNSLINAVTLGQLHTLSSKL